MYTVRTNLRQAQTRLEAAQKKLHRAYKLAMQKGYADKWTLAIAQALAHNSETIEQINKTAAVIMGP